MKRTVLIPILFSWLFNFSLNGQTQTIRGTVVDEDTKTPLIGATISILDVESLIGTVTDADGIFRLENIPIGRVSFVVSYLGYQNNLLSNIEVNSAKEIVLDIGLSESVIKMEKIVVTASAKKGKALNELAIISSRSVSAEQTSRFAGGFNDPSKITSNFAGVANTQDGGNDIIVRGNSPKYIQWRLEGAEITNPNHFGDQNAVSGIVGALNNNLLSTSDFHTGAFPAEFGDALSGVYDIRMRKGNNEKFEGIFGFGLLGTDITVEGPFKKGYRGSYLANFRYSTLGLATDLGLVPVEDVNIKFQDAAFKLWLPTKDFGAFSIFGLQGNSSFGFQDVDPSVWVTPGNDFAQTTITEDYDKGANLLNIGVNHIINLTPESYLKTTLLYSREGIQDDVSENLMLVDSTASSRLKFQSGLNKTAYRINSSYHHKINVHHKMVVGVQYNLLQQDLAQTFLDGNGDRQALIDFDEKISSLRSFISWKFIPNEKLTLVTGLHNTNVLFNNKFTIEPRFAINYNINNSSALSFGFGIHSKMENIHNYFVETQQPNGTTNSPNLDLGLLKASHCVAGYEKYFNNNLRMKVEAYLQDLWNIPVANDINSSYTTLNEGLELNYVDLVNEGKSQNYGIELTLERFLNNGFYFLFNTSIYESTYKALDGVKRNTRFNSNYLVNVLAGKEFTNLGKKNNQIFAANIKTFLGGGRYFVPLLRDENGNLSVDVDNGLIFDESKAYQTKLDDFANIVLSLSYKWNKKKTTHELFLNIDNITNNQARMREYYDVNEPGGVGYERQVGTVPNFLYRLYF